MKRIANIVIAAVLAAATINAADAWTLSALTARCFAADNGTVEGAVEMNTQKGIDGSAGLRDSYSDTWTLTDALGRTAEPPTRKSTRREGKYVLIFYHIWHSDFMRSTVTVDKKAPRNVSAILESDPDARNNASLWGPEISYHYWGEPLYGFYDLVSLAL